MKWKGWASPKNLKERASQKEGKKTKPLKIESVSLLHFIRIDKNYIRATPLNMVWRGADRDLLFERNDLKLQIPKEQLRMPLTNVENQIELEESQNIENQSNEISIHESAVKFSNAKNWGNKTLFAHY